MSVISGPDLRNLLEGETIPQPTPIIGTNFVLAPVTPKIFKPSESPVHFFEVMEETERIGLAHIVLDHDKPELAAVGHLCVRLSAYRMEPHILAEVAQMLREYFFQAGFSVLRIVVPAEQAAAVKGCQLLGPTDAPLAQQFQGKPTLTFLYK